MNDESNQYSISDLFMQAAKRLKKEFDYVRSTNPHSATKGSEAEKTLREFLNRHMPQRFRAATGILIDTNNALSKQTDVIVYDALSSPVYRFSEDAMILPIDTAASVIEVKSRLTTEELQDAYRKIASVKSLKKRPSCELDLEATGSKLKMASTLGIIFAFSSAIQIETIAEKMVELNQTVDSQLWPDMVVLLEVGTVNYALRSPGGELSGDLMPREDIFPIAPFYVNLTLRKDGELSLNRFFITLLSHLQFFPHRPSVPPFDLALAGTAREAISVASYQYDRNKKLLPQSRSNLQLPATIQIKDNDGKLVAALDWIPWPSGGVVTCEVGAPLEMFLLLVGFAKDEQVFKCGKRQYSSVLPVTRPEFLRWPSKLNQKMKGMTAEVVVLKEEHVSDEGTSTPFIARMLAGISEVAQQTLPSGLSEGLLKQYPAKELLLLRKLYREIGSLPNVPEEFAAAFMQAAETPTKKILEIAKSLGVNASFLIYREPAYLKNLQGSNDLVLAQYLQEHRQAWAKMLAEYTNASSAKQSELNQKANVSDLAGIYNGAAKLCEEILVYAFQKNALAGLKIRQLERAERNPQYQIRFVTDLKKSWQLVFSSANFDDL